jgi:hypothetical protein
MKSSQTIRSKTRQFNPVPVERKRIYWGKQFTTTNKEKVGIIDDVIISPDHTVSFAIIGVGGFLGIGRRDSYEPTRHGPGPIHFAWRNRGSAQGTSVI